MKRTKKILSLALCMVLLVAATVATTVAYLTDDDAVTNTFTVGNVAINLDETEIIEGVETGERTETGNEYHLLPGQAYTKDPTVTVAAGSEDCWVFVKVENGLADIEDPEHTILSQMTENWTVVDETEGIYAYKEVLSAGDQAVVFESFVISGDIDNITLAEYEDAVIKVTAYAVQEAGFEGDAAGAWEAAFCTCENGTE